MPINTRNLKGGEWGFALVAIAGPVTNFLLAFAFFLIGHFTGAFYGDLSFGGIVCYAGVYPKYGLLLYLILFRFRHLMVVVCYMLWRQRGARFYAQDGAIWHYCNLCVNFSWRHVILELYGSWRKGIVDFFYWIVGASSQSVNEYEATDSGVGNL